MSYEDRESEGEKKEAYYNIYLSVVAGLNINRALFFHESMCGKSDSLELNYV